MHGSCLGEYMVANTKHEKRAVLLWLLLVIGIFAIPLLPQYINKPVQLDILPNTGATSAVVFFGFQGCADFCPTTLLTLAKFVEKSNSSYSAPLVVFIDIEQASNTASADKYAKLFHQSFQGLHVSSEKLKQLSEIFGLNIQQQDGQISHLGKTYLLERTEQQWHLLKALPPKQVSVSSLNTHLLN